MTQTIQSRYFGETVLDNHFNSLVADGVDMTVNGNIVAIDLWFEENDRVTEAHIKGVDHFLDNAEPHMTTILQTLRKSYEQNEAVKEYCLWHLEELDGAALAELGIEPSWDKDTQLNYLFSILHLVRVGVYPTDGIGEDYAVFDFTINREITDELIVVRTDENGRIIEITTES